MRIQKSVRVPGLELNEVEVAPVGFSERSALATPCSGKISIYESSKTVSKGTV